MTPDSFTDGGVNLSPAKAIKTGKAMWADGASIIDVGGESTRPGAAPVTLNQELARILPPIAGLVRDNIRVSVDTRHAAVMTRATAAGASIINDVGGLRGDGAMAAAAASGAPVVIMHMQGTPETMQKSPSYTILHLLIFMSFLIIGSKLQLTLVFQDRQLPLILGLVLASLYGTIYSLSIGCHCFKALVLRCCLGQAANPQLPNCPEVSRLKTGSRDRWP